MHAITTTSALAIAFAIGACAPAAKTTETVAPSLATSATSSETAEPAQAPPPMGKRAAPPPGESLSPIMAFKGGGEGWRIELLNTERYDHRTTLTWDNGAQRGEGTLTWQPAPDGSLERKVLAGRLNAAGDGKDATVELIEDDCTGGDGITHDHTVIVTVSGMAPMRGCGDIAI